MGSRLLGAYAGTFSGLRVIDISDPADPTQAAFEPCKGGQFDVSVWGDLLFASVDTSQTNPGCNSSNTSTAKPNAWEGVRSFDISDPTDPSLITSVRTDCGSHTHTPPGFLLDTDGCHDITVLQPRKLAAAACLSVGQLWDISDPTAPQPIHTFTTPEVRAWHSWACRASSVKTTTARCTTTTSCRGSTATSWSLRPITAAPRWPM